MSLSSGAPISRRVTTWRFRSYRIRELSSASVLSRMQYILEAGGSGYFRMKVVQPYLRNGRLRLVPGASEFAYPAYAVYSESADAQIVTPSLVGLRHVAGSGPHERLGQANALNIRRVASNSRRPNTLNRKLPG